MEVLKSKYEYTLDDVLSEHYETDIEEGVFVNMDYVWDHIEELIKLPDVVVPYLWFPSLRKYFARRLSEEEEAAKAGGKCGVYIWYSLFDHQDRSFEDTKGDDVRLALYIAEKYPEHSEIIIFDDGS